MMKGKSHLNLYLINTKKKKKEFIFDDVKIPYFLVMNHVEITLEITFDYVKRFVNKNVILNDQPFRSIRVDDLTTILC